MKNLVAVFLAAALAFCLTSSLDAVATEDGSLFTEETAITDALPPAVDVAEVTPRDPELENALAGGLKALNLFQGVSSTDFELDRSPTRTEAVIMLIRLLGKENEAKSFTGTHPFTDVPFWADSYIGYAYEKGLTKGDSETTFGAGREADAGMFLTFVLRALGYSDDEGDFEWDDPYALAAEAGVLPSGVQINEFWRGDVVLVSYAALEAKLSDGGDTLAQSLIASGAFTDEDFEKYYDAQALENGKVSQEVSDAVEEYQRYCNLDDGLDITGMNIVYHSSVVEIGDAGYELYGIYKAGAKKCADKVNTAASNLDGKARVFYLIAPNSLGVVLSVASRERVSNGDEKAGITYSYECANDKVYTVDAYTELRAHNDEYVYFRTDHHWTALGAYYAYTAWAKKAGVEPTKLSDYTVLDMPGHLGLFYTMSGSPYSMKTNPDCVTAYIPTGDFSVKVTNTYGSVSDGKLVWDYSSNAYKYGCFIGGDNPLTVITNNSIEDDSSCVLVKDSYGNPFAVYLAQHYKTVYVLDYRYYGKLSGYMTLSQMEQTYGIDDVVVLLSMTLSQADGTAGFLAKFLQ
jgi:hypothetical protein